MLIRVNHKGPGHPWKPMPIEDLIAQPNTFEPLVVVDQREYDYLQGLSLMIGRELDVCFWGTIPVGTKAFFTYVHIPNLSQGEQG